MPENVQPPSLMAQLIDRAENLQKGRRQVEQDLAELYGEVKAHGFNVKVFKKLLAKRAADGAQASEEDSLLELYERAAKGGA